jgi:hypothetical protein
LDFTSEATELGSDAAVILAAPDAKMRERRALHLGLEVFRRRLRSRRPHLRTDEYRIIAQDVIRRSSRKTGSSPETASIS